MALADKFALLFISPAETEIMKDTVLFLHINTSSFILLGSLSILRYTIQGAGYTRLSIFSGVSEMIARVLVSLYLVPALKFVGVCLGDPTAWLFANLFLIPAFVYVYHQLKGRMPVNGCRPTPDRHPFAAGLRVTCPHACSAVLSDGMFFSVIPLAISVNLRRGRCRLGK